VETKPQNPKASHDRRDDEEAKERKRFAILMVAASLFLLIFALTLKPSQPPVNREEMTSLSDADHTAWQARRTRAPRTYDQRVQEHMMRMGEELNRQRIKAQYENLSARPVPKGAPGPKASDPILRGVPLEGEKHEFEGMVGQAPQARSLAYPDADINASIQSQRTQLRELEDLNERERREYLRQFIRNAEAMGYRVKIDKDFNVEYAPIDGHENQRGPSRVPDSEAAPSESGTGRAH
jgi:hypothetical protein